MAELKITDLPLITEAEFTSNDRFLMIDDGNARAMTKAVFEQWISNNVQGEKGEQGVAGKDGINGTNGATGATGSDGLSAYQIALSQGYVGTQTQWLASLKGATGSNGINGFNGWSPLLRTALRGSDVVLEVFDWSGGTGTKPTVLGYVGSTGIVTNISNATNIRGTKGDQGIKGDTGLTGAAGQDGADGKIAESISFNGNLSATVLYTDGTSLTSTVPPKKTGWGTYKDTQYTSASAFSVATNSQSVLPNNASVKIEHAPTGLSTFYNPTTQKYLLADTAGYYSVRVRFKVESSASASYLNISMSKDTTEIPYSEDRALRGDNTVQDVSFSTQIYGDEALSLNGLTIRIKAYDRAINIYNIEVMVAKLI